MKTNIRRSSTLLAETEDAVGVSLAEPPIASHEATDVPVRTAVSVIIPVRNDPENLALCLSALAASENAEFEIIVVDDASTDTTADVARRHDVQLIQQETRTGPAAARNRGARLARYPNLFFVDADVCVEPRTVRQVAEKFRSSPDVDAFFGSYDESPGAQNFLSQYRNLLHHWVHQAGNKKAFSFWSGCGAIKKSVFLELGGFDVGFANASVEDIELGSRLRQEGHRVELVKALRVKHMKRWTFWRMVRTDIQQRGIPWTQLLLRQGKIPDDLNLRYGQRLSALLSAGFVMAAILGIWFQGPLQLWAALALGCLVGVVLLNWGFYRFLAQVKQPLFALAALPLHVLYYLYSSFAFAAGLALHLGHVLRSRRSAS